MAINRYFRPTQHVYQPTYQALPFEQLAAATQPLQQKYEQNVQNLAATEDFTESQPSASFDSPTVDKKMQEIRDRLGEIKQKTSSGMETISPEFNLELGQVVNKIKSDPFWKNTAVNAEREKEYKKLIYDDSKPIANRWPLIKRLQKATEDGSEKYILPEASVRDYVNYHEKLETYADNFMPSGFIKDTDTGEWIERETGEGIDPRNVANILGIELTKNGMQLKESGIPKEFYNSPAGIQLRGEAEYQYDISDPEYMKEKGLGIRDFEELLYLQTASPLVSKFSGGTEGFELKGQRNTDIELPLGIGSFLNTVGKLGDSEKAEKIKGKFRGSFMAKVFDFFLGPDEMESMRKANRSTINKYREQGLSEEEIAVKIVDDAVGDISDNVIGNSGNRLYSGFGAVITQMVKEADKVMIRAVVDTTTPSLGALSEEDKNGIYNMFAERPDLLEKFNKADNKLTPDLWEEYKDYSVDFYTEKDYSVSITPAQSDEEKEQYTKLLFGRGSTSGRLNVETTNEGLFQGIVSKLQLYDIAEGKTPTTLKELELDANTEYDVIYTGEGSGDNPYGADIRLITINGKDYYVDVLSEKTPTQKLIDHGLHSFKYTHNKEGVPFSVADIEGRPILDDNGDIIVAVSSKESTIGSDGKSVEEYVVTTNTGLNFRSTINIIDAWNQLQKNFNK